MAAARIVAGLHPLQLAAKHYEFRLFVETAAPMAVGPDLPKRRAAPTKLFLGGLCELSLHVGRAELERNPAHLLYKAKALALQGNQPEA